MSNQAEQRNFIAVTRQLTEAYAKKNPSLRWTFDMASQATIMQKVQVQAASDSLPLLFTLPDTAALKDLYNSGRILNLAEKFEELGLIDAVHPLALERLRNAENMGDDVIYEIPFSMNIEAFSYNKALFRQVGADVPTTWQELLQVCEKMKAADIVCISASGVEGWPLARLIGMYAQRRMGNHAMDRVRDGSLRLDDPGFVESAAAIQDLAAAGHLGAAVTTLNYQGMVNQFLGGKAAIIWGGSWLISSLEDQSITTIPASDFGFFNFPTVPNGTGTIDAWIVTAGLTGAVATTAYGADKERIDGWMKYVFSRYGDAARKANFISGFTPMDTTIPVSPLLTELEANLPKVKAGLWPYEQHFKSKAFILAGSTSGLLVSGALSPEKYMQNLQAANQ